MQVLKEVLFYTSYRFNGITDSHSNTELTDRNDLVLTALHSIASPGAFCVYASSIDSLHGKIAQDLLKANELGPIVLVTPELGKWSTVGGLGVMVDNLSKALAKQGEEVIVISPYYDKDRYGNTECSKHWRMRCSYLKKDDILFEETLPIQMPSGETLEVGFHRGMINRITYVFFHHAQTFARPYPSGSPAFMMQCPPRPPS